MSRTQAQLGLEGTTFANSFVSLSLCCPSRATLLTGRYAHNHGVLDIVPPHGGYERLDHSETLAVWLQRAGYATVLLGKYLNHYGRRNPIEVPAGLDRVARAGGPVDVLLLPLRRSTTTACCASTAASYQTDVITERAEEIVARRAAAPEPFFLWVGYLAPAQRAAARAGRPAGHADARRRAAARRRLRRRRRFPRIAVVRRGRRARQAARRSRRAAARLGAAQRRSTRTTGRSWSRCWRSTRASTGSSRRCGARGELEDTLIVFTSDNGFMHGEHRVPAGKRAALRAVDPRAAADARSGRPARAARRRGSPPTSTSRRRCSTRPARRAPWTPDGVSLLGAAARARATS